MLTELAVDGEHIPRFPIYEPEVPERHILQQEDECPPHVVIECLHVSSIFFLIIEGDNKVNQTPYIEKEYDLYDDDCQQGLQGLRHGEYVSQTGSLHRIWYAARCHFSCTWQ